MSQEITAYLSEDGRIFRNKPDADFADYMGAVGARVATFMADLERVQTSDPAELLVAFELYRIGGRPGWERRQEQTARAEPAAAQVAAPPEPAAETVPVRVRAKPGPKPKPKVAKEPTAISEALDAARVVRERKQAEARPGAKAEPVYRKHVGVIGLFNIHHANIAKHFEGALKLTIYDADCVSRLHGLRACHKVVVMTKFVSHKHIDALKAIGQEPLLVHGGLDKLKEALTTIYVNS